MDQRESSAHRQPWFLRTLLCSLAYGLGGAVLILMLAYFGSKMGQGTVSQAIPGRPVPPRTAFVDQAVMNKIALWVFLGGFVISFMNTVAERPWAPRRRSGRRRR